MGKVFVKINEAQEEILLCIYSLQQQIKKVDSKVLVLSKKLSNFQFHIIEKDKQTPTLI